MPKFVANRRNRRNRVTVNNDYTYGSGRRSRSNKGRKVVTTVKADARDASKLNNDDISRHISKLEKLFSHTDTVADKEDRSRNLARYNPDRSHRGNDGSTNMRAKPNIASSNKVPSNKKRSTRFDDANRRSLRHDNDLLDKQPLYRRISQGIRDIMHSISSESRIFEVIPIDYYEKLLSQICSYSDKEIMEKIGADIVDIFRNRTKAVSNAYIVSRVRDLIMLPCFSREECAKEIDCITQDWEILKSAYDVSGCTGDIHTFILSDYVNAETINARMMHDPKERENLHLCILNMVEEQIEKFCERVIEAKEHFIAINKRGYVNCKKMRSAGSDILDRADAMGYQNICDLICDEETRERMKADTKTRSIYWEKKSLANESKSDKRVPEFALELAAFFEFEKTKGMKPSDKKIERGESFHNVFSEAWSNMRDLISECTVAKDKCVANTAFSHVTQIEDVVASSVCCDRSQDIHSV